MEQAYFLQRMRSSIEMARNATGSVARLIHLDLAGRFCLAAASLLPTIREAGLRVVPQELGPQW